MHFPVIFLLTFASSASAQIPPSVDCNEVRDSAIPVELAYHGQDGTKTLVQMYRDTPGNHVAWIRQTPPSTRPNPPVFVTRATHVDGALVSARLSTPYAGKHAYRAAKYTSDGLPKHFDRRSDVTYKLHAVITPADGIVEEHTSTIAYKFKSEGTITVGSCVIQVIRGETDTTSDARTRHSFQLYFPELQISAVANDAEPVVDSLSTVITRFEPGN